MREGANVPFPRIKFFEIEEEKMADYQFRLSAGEEETKWFPEGKNFVLRWRSETRGGSAHVEISIRQNGKIIYSVSGNHCAQRLFIPIGGRLVFRNNNNYEITVHAYMEE